MAETNTSGATAKKRSGDKRSLVDIATELIGRDGEKAFCRIDSRSGCSYVQTKLDVGNFIRHFRSQHPEKSSARGLLINFDSAAKKPRIIAKHPVAVDKPLIIESLIKLITYHQLPLACFEWEGLRMILDPLASAVGLTINSTNMKVHMKNIAARIKNILKEEMKSRLVSIKVDSASRFHRHILGINAQYVLDGRVVVRTLAMIEVRESQTAAFLKSKILDTLQGYGVQIHQIFSVTCDNGANMLAAVRKLKQELQLTLLTTIDESEDDDEVEQRDLTAELCTEFSERLNLIRCAVHSLQLAIHDVVKRGDEMIKNVTAVAKKCKLTKYKTHFEFHNARYPPVWSQTRWGGIFEMMDCFRTQKNFFTDLSQQFPELDLTDTWQYIENYVEAFKPAFICTKNMQASHVSLPDFYMAWLLVISEIQRIEENPFVSELVDALTNRLRNLRESRAFKMALYLDPRFNYLGSKIFTSEEKEQTQGYIIDTWSRIKELQPCSTSNQSASSVAVTAKNDEFDQFLTDLFGGAMQAESSTSTFLHQMKVLDVEPRQNHNYNSFQHWLNRAQTHPELFNVAMVVLAVPSNQVSVERSFSALGLVLSSHRTALGEETLADILLVKLNKELFDDAMVNLYNWKDTKSFE